MNIGKSSGGISSVDQVTFELEKLTESIQELKKGHGSINKISKEMQSTVNALASCNNTLQDKNVSTDKEMSKKLQNLLNALTGLKFLSNDKTLQEKVNSLQTGLFASYIDGLNRLEKNLIDGNLRLGLKVEKSGGTNTTR